MNLYNYVFHFNTFDDIWYAIPRDLYMEYWSNRNIHGILKAKNINVLVEMINRGEEFIKSIK